MNLGSMIKNAAGRFAGRTGTGGAARGTGLNATGRTPGTTGAAGARPGGAAGRIMGMLRRR
ncbi:MULTISPECIES: hypothetical protein [Pseudarthrobacter]|uniref:hypothetical protein n=1 Tax=Pseudarthrobacter TaxID=1742993 RepID=UPI001573E31F|nr:MULTISPECIES: hypothetical protein [Pseudarthrobacter]MBA4103434.1 hypothetical protein [Arthrobacter sp.]MDV2979401.1 hypothetical protein [Actinomycetes bacterium ARC8]WHP57614.1 hypothetical protein QMY03_11590 [Arthrobacter sp. KFRI-F3372]NSX38876.1 hypothetical protein [Pseudarthrobacter oxydans]BFE45896.1 hypothetical protein GCM10017547_37890 [Pseudarthrobacter oxydans]